MKYQHITIGGTFDHFHNGHKAMIDAAFENGETVWLGITTDDFARTFKSKYTENTPSLEPFDRRRQSVESYLADKKWSERVKIVSLTNRYGTTTTDPALEAIVVSPETENIAIEINQKRGGKGWKALEIILVEWINAQDTIPIHSIRIRGGEIDEKGELFAVSHSWGKRKITDELRLKLKTPLSELIIDHSKNHEQAMSTVFNQFTDYSLLITVGDAVTASCLAIGKTPELSIIDLYIERTKVFNNWRELGFTVNATVFPLLNPAGTLSSQGFELVSSIIQTKKFPGIIHVDGEEDLLTLFAILAAPLNSLVLYGQPREGIVAVSVTIEKKREVQEMLQQFI